MLSCNIKHLLNDFLSIERASGIVRISDYNGAGLLRNLASQIIYVRLPPVSLNRLLSYGFAIEEFSVGNVRRVSWAWK